HGPCLYRRRRLRRGPAARRVLECRRAVDGIADEPARRGRGGPEARQGAAPARTAAGGGQAHRAQGDRTEVARARTGPVWPCPLRAPHGALMAAASASRLHRRTSRTGAAGTCHIRSLAPLTPWPPT